MKHSHHTQTKLEHHRPSYKDAVKHRNFKYIENEFPSGTTLDSMEREFNDTGSIWTYSTCPYVDTCKHCGQRVRHSDSMVVAIDGGCRGNGTPNARSAISVWFGTDNMYNFCGVLDFDREPTNQKAELSAAIKALETVRRIREHDSDLDAVDTLIIKTDSAYLVNSMSQYIFKWKKNGFKTSQGQPVKNKGLLQYIDHLVDELSSKDGISVCFWHVRREYNLQADGQVNVALDAQIGAPRVYIVCPKIQQYPWFLEMYDELIQLLQARASVCLVESIKNLDSLVEGPSTRFLFVDEAVTEPRNRQDMLKFTAAVREQGSRIALGCLVPNMGTPKNIDLLFEKVFGLRWRYGSYTKDDYILHQHDTKYSTENLIDSEYLKAVFLEHVSANDMFYEGKDTAEALAACSRIGDGFLGYIGAINCESLMVRAILALLGLPPVYTERPCRLLTKAVRVADGYGGSFFDRFAVDF